MDPPCRKARNSEVDMRVYRKATTVASGSLSSCAECADPAAA